MLRMLPQTCTTGVDFGMTRTFTSESGGHLPGACASIRLELATSVRTTTMARIDRFGGGDVSVHAWLASSRSQPAVDDVAVWRQRTQGARDEPVRESVSRTLRNPNGSGEPALLAR